MLLAGAVTKHTADTAPAPRACSLEPQRSLKCGPSHSAFASKGTSQNTLTQTTGGAVALAVRQSHGSSKHASGNGAKATDGGDLLPGHKQLPIRSEVLHPLMPDALIQDVVAPGPQLRKKFNNRVPRELWGLISDDYANGNHIATTGAGAMLTGWAKRCDSSGNGTGADGATPANAIEGAGLPMRMADPQQPGSRQHGDGGARATRGMLARAKNLPPPPAEGLRAQRLAQLPPVKRHKGASAGSGGGDKAQRGGGGGGQPVALPLEPMRVVLRPEDGRALQLLTSACFPNGSSLTVLGTLLSPNCTRCFLALQKAALCELKSQPQVPGLDSCRQQLLPFVCAQRSQVYKELFNEVPSPPGTNGTNDTLKPADRAHLHNVIARLELQLVDAIIQHAADITQRPVEELCAWQVAFCLPDFLKCDCRVQRYQVGEEDPRVALRGQWGAKSVADIKAWSLLGPYSSTQMLNMEYLRFQARPPALLLHQMSTLLEKQFAPHEQVPMPGPLQALLRDLFHACRGVALQAARIMLHHCTSLVEEVSPEEEDARHVGRTQAKPGGGRKGKKSLKRNGSGGAPLADGEDEALREPKSTLVAHAPAGLLAAAMRRLMLQQLRQVMRRVNVEVPADVQRDELVLQGMLDVAEQEWTLQCDSYGADFEAQYRLGPDGTESLSKILIDADEELEDVANMLLQNHVLTQTALPDWANEMALVNDPAIHLPDRMGTWRQEYDVESNDANAQPVLFQVLGWPLLFLVSRRDIAKGEVLSFAYGHEYWLLVHDRQKTLQLTKDSLELKAQQARQRLQALAPAAALSASTHNTHGAPTAGGPSLPLLQPSPRKRMQAHAEPPARDMESAVILDGDEDGGDANRQRAPVPGPGPRNAPPVPPPVLSPRKQQRQQGPAAVAAAAAQQAGGAGPGGGNAQLPSSFSAGQAARSGASLPAPPLPAPAAGAKPPAPWLAKPPPPPQLLDRGSSSATGANGSSIVEGVSGIPIHGGRPASSVLSPAAQTPHEVVAESLSVDDVPPGVCAVPNPHAGGCAVPNPHAGGAVGGPAQHAQHSQQQASGGCGVGGSGSAGRRIYRYVLQAGVGEMASALASSLTPAAQLLQHVALAHAGGGGGGLDRQDSSQGSHVGDLALWSHARAAYASGDATHGGSSATGSVVAGGAAGGPAVAAAFGPLGLPPRPGVLRAQRPMAQDWSVSAASRLLSSSQPYPNPSAARHGGAGAGGMPGGPLLPQQQQRLHEQAHVAWGLGSPGGSGPAAAAAAAAHSPAPGAALVGTDGSSGHTRAGASGQAVTATPSSALPQGSLPGLAPPPPQQQLPSTNSSSQGLACAEGPALALGAPPLPAGPPRLTARACEGSDMQVVAQPPPQAGSTNLQPPLWQPASWPPTSSGSEPTPATPQQWGQQVLQTWGTHTQKQEQQQLLHAPQHMYASQYQAPPPQPQSQQVFLGVLGQPTLPGITPQDVMEAAMVGATTASMMMSGMANPNGSMVNHHAGGAFALPGVGPAPGGFHPGGAHGGAHNGMAAPQGLQIPLVASQTQPQHGFMQPQQQAEFTAHLQGGGYLHASPGAAAAPPHPLDPTFDSMAALMQQQQEPAAAGLSQAAGPRSMLLPGYGAGSFLSGSQMHGRGVMQTLVPPACGGWGAMGQGPPMALLPQQQHPPAAMVWGPQPPGAWQG